jgi:hypothetical protein
MLRAVRPKVDVSRDPERRRLKRPVGLVHHFIHPFDVKVNGAAGNFANLPRV